MTTQLFRFTLFLLICFSIPLTATTQTVDIPDSNLRAAIADALGKASGDIITVADMLTLTLLSAPDANITDLTGLESAMNLKELWLAGNTISDISALAGLTNLTYLWLNGNAISDLSPLVANTGLGAGDAVEVRGNPLSSTSIKTHIPTLQTRGITIKFDAPNQPYLPVDVNGDGMVNTIDLVRVAFFFGQRVQNEADVNRDGVVNIDDLLQVASAISNVEAAPSTQSPAPEILTAVEVQQWLTDARALGVRDPIMKRGIVVLEQLLISLLPKETALLPNYLNPFNPETWISYHLASAADVTFTIYDAKGTIVRQLDLGYQSAGYYTTRSKAAYWDGRNESGESVASGVYFYQLRVGRSGLSVPHRRDYTAVRRMAIVK